MKSPVSLKETPLTFEERRILYAEQVRQLYRNGFVGLLASIINSLVLAVVQRDVVSRSASITWVVSLALIGLLRYLDIRSFWRASPDTSDADHWAKRFIVGLALSGMAWGSSAIFLFPIEALAHQTFLAFVIGGMVAGAAAAFSSLMTAFLAYSVPALAPFIIRFAIAGDEFHLAMGGMTLLFGVILFFIAKWINNITTTSVKLRFKNSDLASYITEHRRMEEMLRESEERFRAIADYGYDWENWFDPNGRLLWVNPSVFRLTGYTADECLTIADFPLPLVHEEDRGTIRRAHDGALRGESANDIGFRICCKDGSTKWVAVSYQPICDAAGSSLGYRSSIRDITRRRQYQEEREGLILNLEEALAKVRTLSGMLPICASCKRIRVDDGYWEQIEVYLREHSHAEFSHGICPECAERLYPGIFKKK